MRIFVASTILTLASTQLFANEVTQCTLVFTCANAHPCQTTKTGEGIDFEFEKLPGDQLRVDLGDGGLPLFDIVQVSDDLMTGFGWNEDLSASYTFSVFADGIVAYTTHVYTGKGISLTGLGRCEM